MASDNTVRFELTQLVREDLLGNLGDFLPELGKTARAEGEMPKDLHLPLAGKDIDGSLDRTAVMVFHNRTQCFPEARALG